jgi:hypothetical protein
VEDADVALKFVGAEGVPDALVVADAQLEYAEFPEES